MDSKYDETIRGHFIVRKEMTAKEVGSGGLEVLSTPTLITLFESESYKAVEDSLKSSQTTVGTRILFKHLAPSALHAEIDYQIKYQRVGERRFTFEFEAHEGQKLIATGEHDRVVVDSKLFLQKSKENNES